MTSTICSLNRLEDPVVIKKPMLRPLAAVLILGVANLAPACLTPAFAAAGKITFVSQGGTYQEAQTKAILDPAAKQLNITVNQDSIPDAWPQIKAQAATGKPIWDVVDTPTSNCLRGGKEGLLEKLDFSKIPNAAAMPEKYRTPYSVAYEFYSTVIGYNKKTLKKVPQNWADFWNVEQFPGRRGLQQSPMVNLEIALMADGVPPDKIYPIDVDRAFKVLDRIKSHVNVWWSSGAQSTQLLQSAEVDLLSIWSARAQTTIDAGTPAKIVWNGNIASVDGWSIPKGCPRLDAAQQFVRFCMAPDRQAAYTPTMKNGPTNAKAYDSIPPDRAALLPTSPANRKVMLVRDDEWWGANFAAMKQRFDAWLLET